MFAQKRLDSLKKIILAPTTQVIITSHKSPDGDSIGSTLGLYHFLKKLNVSCRVIIPDAVPDYLSWLPNTKDIVIYESQAEQALELIDKANLHFILDYNAYDRIGNLGAVIETKTHLTTVLLDHHQEPKIVPTFSFWNVEASSTCQLVYEFIEKMEQTALIDPIIAECIYTGIMTDTGSFRFPITSAKTHLIVSRLIDFGVKIENVHSKIADQSSFNRLKLLGYTLGQKMMLLDEYKTIIMGLTKAELENHQHEKGDTEGFVNYGLSIHGIKLSILVTELEDRIRISFRSKGDFKVNEFSKNHFGGGGHMNASGGNGEISVEHTIQKIISLLPLYKANLNA